MIKYFLIKFCPIAIFTKQIMLNQSILSEIVTERNSTSRDAKLTETLPIETRLHVINLTEIFTYGLLFRLNLYQIKLG